jgi:dethiobiotin synthetase
MTLFIAGTDTGIGKTVVTALVTRRLQAGGKSAIAIKPMASGCELRDGILVSEDAEFLKHATRCSESLDTTNPIRWEEPLAPLVCARRAGVSAADVLLQTAALIGELKARYDCVVVEGVGGLLAPIGEGATIWTNIEMAALCDETLLVARRTLGTVNHTTLTARAAQSAGLNLHGLVFCDAVAVAPDDIAAHTSPALCAEMTGLPILGEIPFLYSLDEASLQAAQDLLIWP